MHDLSIQSVAKPPCSQRGKLPATCCAALLIVGLLLLGCNDSQPSGPRRGPASQAKAQGGLFVAVADSLNHLEQFETNQILRQTSERLNQWYVQEKPAFAWQLDPLVAGLSPDLKKLPEVRTLETVRFQDPDDGWFLQEAVWLRDISKQARADQFKDLAVAERLFDWTVRNIQLEPSEPVASKGSADNKAAIKHRPYETLLLGRGDAMERAWVFILLARQQGLEVVYLGLGDEMGKNVRPWLPALALDGELYLFDSRLGLPIAGAEPGSIATLSQVVADPALLTKLDLDSEHPYPVRADDLKHVVAFVEGSPGSLSQRMALVESRLAGKNRLALTSLASATAERVKKLPHVAEVRLWPYPFEVAEARRLLNAAEKQAAARELLVFQGMPALKRGRALQFKGEFEGDEGAKNQFLNSRPSDQYIDNYKLSEQDAKQIPRASVSKVEAAQVLLMKHAKLLASLWLGQIFMEQGDYANAVDFLSERTLKPASKGVLANTARYNLARAYEAAGQIDKAIETYESDTASPQSHGNQLRARRLKAAAAPPEKVEPQPEKPADSGEKPEPPQSPAEDHQEAKPEDANPEASQLEPPA